MIEHLQVPFKTLDDAEVQVDEGLFDILTRLKELGVRTQYSCQGNAYVVADRKSFAPVLRVIRRMYKKGLYSPKQMELARCLFANGYERHVHIDFKSEDGYAYTGMFKLRLNRRRTQYVIEKHYSNVFGFRTTLRWPEEKNLDFLHLLNETKASQNLHG